MLRLIFICACAVLLFACDEDEPGGVSAELDNPGPTRLDGGTVHSKPDPSGGTSMSDSRPSVPNLDAGTLPPTPPQIVINEIMYDPSAVADAAGEWIELTNAGADPVNLQGWTLQENSTTNRHLISASVVIDPGAYVVLGVSDTMNGGYTADYAYGSAFKLRNSKDTIELKDSTGLTIDTVTYDDVAPWPERAVGMYGYSIELLGPTLDNTNPANWQFATQTFGDGDHGTPGLPNGGGNQSNSMIDANIPDWHQTTLKASLYFAPKDPLQSIVLSHLESAQTSIRLAFFNIRLPQILTILTNKKNAGVDVQVILDKKQQDKFYNDMGERMLMTGIPVSLVERTEAMDSTMHNKFTIIDGKIVLTGSANYSHTAFNISDEDMLIMENTDLAARYQVEFDELIAGRDVDSPMYASGTALRAWMGPEDNLHDKVKDFIDSAQRQLLIAMFQLNATAIIEAIIAAKNRGVNVVVILDERQANQPESIADETLRAANIPLVIADARGGSFAEMHSKFVTVDHQKLIVGSFNWTNLGAFFNDENIVEIDDAHLAARAEGKFAYLLNTYTSSTASYFGLPGGTQAVSFEVINVTLGSNDKLFLKSIGGGPFDPGVEMVGTTYSTMLNAGTSFEYVYEIRDNGVVLAREVGNHSFTVPYAPGPFQISNAFEQ